MPKLTFLLLLCLLATQLPLQAQRVLLLENSRSSKAQRYFEGQEIVFRMKGDKFWQNGYIRELRPDIQSIVVNDRYVMLNELDALQLPGSGFATGIGYSLMTFGAGWSFFALLGYATDRQPDTRYSTGDAAVTLAAMGSGFLIKSLFARKKYKLSDKKRLRIVDITF